MLWQTSVIFSIIVWISEWMKILGDLDEPLWSYCPVCVKGRVTNLFSFAWDFPGLVWKSPWSSIFLVPGKLGWLVTTVWGFCAWIWSFLCMNLKHSGHTQARWPRREGQSHGPAMVPHISHPLSVLLFNFLTELLRAGGPWCLLLRGLCRKPTGLGSQSQQVKSGITNKPVSSME